VFTITILAAMLTPTLTFAEMPKLTTILLPWNEEVPTLVGEENMWGVLLLLGQLVTLGFIIFAGIRQWRKGERQAALVLLGGMAWFIIALLYEILAEAALFVYVPLAETGFLGIAIALSLQMANSVIKTEEALAASEKNLEAKVAERTIALEAVQVRLIDQAQKTAVIEERRRIARDLHDEVTQTIYSAALITEVLPKVWERSPEEGRRNLTTLRHLVRGALAEMRTLLFELRPSAMENADLDTLLQQLADAFTGRTRIPVDVTVKGHNHLPIGVKVAFYRISQEAFNNISKHADGSQVRVIVKKDTHSVTFSIEDYGQGFDLNEVQSRQTPDRGLGLAAMDERVRLLGGSLKISSEKGKGTHIAFTIPINEVGNKFRAKN